MFEVSVGGIDRSSPIMRKLRRDVPEFVIEGIIGPGRYCGHSFIVESARMSPVVTMRLPARLMEQSRLEHVRQRILDIVRTANMSEQLSVRFTPTGSNDVD